MRMTVPDWDLTVGFCMTEMPSRSLVADAEERTADREATADCMAVLLFRVSATSINTLAPLNVTAKVPVLAPAMPAVTGGYMSAYMVG